MPWECDRLPRGKLPQPGCHLENRMDIESTRDTLGRHAPQAPAVQPPTGGIPGNRGL